MTPDKRVFIFEGIGTHWWIRIVDLVDDEAWKNLQKKILTVAQDFEKNYSRFIPTSYISLLNQNKILKGFPKELYEMITFSEGISTITNNYFSVTIGQKLNRIGYDSQYSFEESNELKASSQILLLSPEIIKIDEHTSLDLGGIGKGWLIDKLSHVILQEGIKSFSVNGGGDIYATEMPDGNEFTFYLENPENADQYIGEIHIKNAAIACSSPTRRRWKDKVTQKENHHLLDALTGRPIDDLKAVFTYGNTALAADSASTAIFVSPFQFIPEIQATLGIEYAVITVDNSAIKSPGYPGEFYA